MNINPTQSLSWNLGQRGISTQQDTENEGKQKWFMGGRHLGSFDAHEGWTILRHHDVSGNILIAIQNASGEHYDMAYPSPVEASLRRDRDGDVIPWAKEHDYFMAFDPANPDIPTD